MEVRDLTDSEREVLLALLAHVAEADDHLDPGEVQELGALAEEMEVDDLIGDMKRARAAVQTEADLRSAAATVVREDARSLIRTLLFDLAQSDGNRSHEENAVLDMVAAVWTQS